jgi:hypothetical protein
MNRPPASAATPVNPTEAQVRQTGTATAAAKAAQTAQPRAFNMFMSKFLMMGKIQ